MSKSRRKVLIRVIEGVAPALILLDAVLYFAVVRPLEKLVAEEQQRYTVTRQRILEERLRVARLEKFQAAIPGADHQLQAFLREHVPPRRRGFSRAARLVRRITDQPGLQLSSVAYHLESIRDEPLQRLGIDIHVEGPFWSVFNFAHALETTNDLVVLRDFTLQSGEDGTLTLRLAADLYLRP